MRKEGRNEGKERGSEERRGEGGREEKEGIQHKPANIKGKLCSFPSTRQHDLKKLNIVGKKETLLN